jgi:hypothetical protein
MSASTIEHIDHIYIVVHPEKEKDRYNYLLSFVSLFPSDYYTFITPFYKDIDSPEPFSNRIKRCNQRISDGAAFLYYTYEVLMKSILETTNYNTVLILESDILCDFNTVKIDLQTMINEFVSLNNLNSMIFLGNGCNLKAHNHTKVTEHLYLMNLSKCTDSMIWTRTSIENCIPHLQIIDNPIDHKLLNIFKSGIINAYWCEPHLFVQGSQNGTYHTTI